MEERFVKEEIAVEEQDAVVGEERGGRISSQQDVFDFPAANVALLVEGVVRVSYPSHAVEFRYKTF